MIHNIIYGREFHSLLEHFRGWEHNLQGWAPLKLAAFVRLLQFSEDLIRGSRDIHIASYISICKAHITYQ